MHQEEFESLAACSEFTGQSESPFGWSAAEKLLKQVTLTLSEASFDIFSFKISRVKPPNFTPHTARD
jgi:hypothetical protein